MTASDPPYDHPRQSGAGTEYVYPKGKDALASQTEPEPGEGERCDLCALGFPPFKAEGIMWHQVNGRDPFRCNDACLSGFHP